MNPRHHPSPDILAAYASGALDAGFALVVGAHAEACSACRAQIAAYEASSGAALSRLPAAEVAPDALSRVMARLEEAAPPPAVDARPLLERLPLKRKRWVAPGVWVAGVDTPHARENRVYLLSVKAGGLTARHEHVGAEFCTVLKGAYRDELGVFAAEVNGILSAFDCAATVLYHDTEVQRVQTWRSGDGELALDPVGGGGTSHRCVFDWLDRSDLAPSCVLCLTDLETRFPDRAPAAPVKCWYKPSLPSRAA